MSRFTICALGLGLLAVLSASPALAVFNPDPSTGGNPAACPQTDKCCICKAEANQKYNKCVQDNCNLAIMKGPQRAVCINTCASVRDQDIVLCTLNGKCA